MRNIRPQLCWMESTHRLDGPQLLSVGWHGVGWHEVEFALDIGLVWCRSVSAVRPGESGSLDYRRVTLAALLSSALACVPSSTVQLTATATIYCGFSQTSTPPLLNLTR